MENNQETKNYNAQPEPYQVTGGQGATEDGKKCVGEGAARTECPGRPPRATRPRKDQGKLHARNHGVLSRNPLEALIRLGENTRHLRKIKKMLRAELRPIGVVGEILFDQAWSSHLRRLLIARVEAHLFMPVDRRDSDRVPELRERDLPTLVFPEACAPNYGFSDDLMKHLETTLRYDAHYSRQFFGAVRLLVAMQTGGLAGLLDCL